MKHLERDLSCLKHIVRYCDEITFAIIAHDLTLEKVESDTFNKNALSMSILQIGELVNVLSRKFKETHDNAPWREIKRMRDKAAHHYINFNTSTLWETVIEDIPPLKEYCLKCIIELEKILSDRQVEQDLLQTKLDFDILNERYNAIKKDPSKLLDEDEFWA